MILFVSGYCLNCNGFVDITHWPPSLAQLVVDEGPAGGVVWETPSPKEKLCLCKNPQVRVVDRVGEEREE